MALFGQLVGLIFNLFWLNNTLYWATTAVGVVLFSAYTAYDVQRFKKYEPRPARITTWSRRMRSSERSRSTSTSSTSFFTCSES
jgi:FtsH-binding integral membrane protein